MSETVNVSAEAIEVMVQRASTELGITIDEQMVNDVPMNGRNFSELLVLQPGVNPMDTSQGNSAGRTNAGGADGGNIAIPGSTIFKVSVNGQGNRSNAYYMDGIINTDDRGGGWSVPPIADTIQELKVQSHNNDVQYGNVLGSVVNIVTKSGTNTFHGSGWEFARSQIFDAATRSPDFVLRRCAPTWPANSIARCPGHADRGGSGRHTLRHSGVANWLFTARVRRDIRRAHHQEQDLLLRSI